MKRLAPRTLQFAIAVAISIGGLIATRSRGDLATEAIVIALIGLSLIGIVSGRLASPARDHLSRIHRSRHILVLEFGHQQCQKVIVTERVGRSGGGSRRSRRGGSGRGNRGYGHDFALSGGLRGGDFAAREHFHCSSGYRAKQFHRLEMARSSDRSNYGFEAGLDLRRLERQQGLVDQLMQQVHRRSRRRGIHEHLDDEIDPAKRRRRLARLYDVSFQEKRGVVQQLDRRLPIQSNNGAVEIASLARPKGDVRDRLSSIRRG
jgi:hypothetical protein